MKNSISQIMLEEHARIEKNLLEVENAIERESSELAKIFNRFKWSVEKHFFVEEKAIFSFLDKAQGESVSDTFDLMEEHGQILQEMNEVEEDLENAKISKLKEMLERHASFEDETFYPNLEKTLNEQQKEEIIERAKEIVRD